MRLVVATNNSEKVRQIKPFFDELPNLEVLSLSDLNLSLEVHEDRDTFADNAIKKATEAHTLTGEWCIGDDSGVCIDALDGLPGVHSKRWAGEGASAQEILSFTLAKLAHVPHERRTAKFVCSVALVGKTGEVHEFGGVVRGRILTEPRGTVSPSMPYSSIFLADGQSCAWSEMDVVAINATSHRGIAFRKLRKFLEKFSM